MDSQSPLSTSTYCENINQTPPINTANTPERFRLVLVDFLAILFCGLIFSIGVALYRIIIPYDFGQKGLSAGVIGNLVSGMALGTFISAITCRKLIMRVGHIRLFCASVAMIIATYTFQSLVSNFWLLLVLLINIGIANSTAFFALESWINQKASHKMRGRLFGVYMMTFYTGLIIGQYSLNLKNILGTGIILLPIIILALSIMPLTFTQSTPPPVLSAPKISIRKLWQKYRLSLLGISVAGFCGGALVLMGPVLASTKNLDDYSMTIFLISSSLGAVIFQYPIGLLGDLIDRRKVILALMISILIMAILILFAPANLYLLCPIMFILGGTSACIYATSANIAFGLMESNEVLGSQTRFMMVGGLSSTVGVITLGWLIEWLGIWGFSLYFAVLAVLLSTATLISILKVSFTSISKKPLRKQ